MMTSSHQDKFGPAIVGLLALMVALGGCDGSADGGDASLDSGTGDADTDADTDADADSDSDADSDTDADAGADGDIDADSDTDGDTDTDADGDGDSDADSDSDADADSDSDTDADSDADADSDSDTGTGTDTDTEVGWCVPSATVPTGWSYLDNGQVKIGVNVGHGAAIGVLEVDGKNVLNNADNGRYLQQSYYGKDIGGSWNGELPRHGCGSCHGVLRIRLRTTWPGGALLPGSGGTVMVRVSTLPCLTNTTRSTFSSML